MKHSKQLNKFALWLCSIILAFLAGTGILLSIVQPAQLKMDVSPPGYPPLGEPWKITVWENSMEGSGWTKSSNVSVTVLTETGDSYILSTDIDGLLEIDYRPEYGKVKITAVKEGFQGVAWSPARRFIALSIVLAFYGVFIAISGVTGKIVYQFFKLEKGLSRSVRSIGYSVAVIQIVETFLVSEWFWNNYKTGPTWGFNSVILGPIEFQHFLLLFGAALVASITLYVLIEVKRKKGNCI